MARSAALLPSSDAPRIAPLASGCLQLPASLIRPRAARRRTKRRRRSAALSRQLRGSLQTIPREPGVYLFHDPDDRTLYVGKSVSLRQRVASYFHASTAGKIRLMVEHAAAVEWRTVGSELEALILESYLIKQHQPPYNVMGREYPRYAFLRLHHGEGFPYLEATTAITPDGASYYGPFWTMRSAEQALDFVSRLFGLRRCEGDLPPEAEARRCLWGQMQRCQAPCLDQEVRARYAESVERAARLLQGEVTPLIGELTRARDEAAERLSFERAARLHGLSNRCKRCGGGATTSRRRPGRSTSWCSCRPTTRLICSFWPLAVGNCGGSTPSGGAWTTRQPQPWASFSAQPSRPRSGSPSIWRSSTRCTSLPSG